MSIEEQIGAARAIAELAREANIRVVTPKMVAHMLVNDGFTKKVTKKDCKIISQLAKDYL